jgi:hypothetical protein
MSSPVQISTGDGTVFVGSTITLEVISANSSLAGFCSEVLRESGETDPVQDFRFRSYIQTTLTPEVRLFGWVHSGLDPLLDAWHRHQVVLNLLDSA